MTEYLLDRETLLDVIVNIIPLVIIAFFFVLYIFSDDYIWQPFIIFISLVLLIVPFGLLALVTYASGWAIEQGEKKQETTKQDPERQVD